MECEIQTGELMWKKELGLKAKCPASQSNQITEIEVASSQNWLALLMPMSILRDWIKSFDVQKEV